jgi:alpha-beta hydrolase superfamily lysophospholipase
MKGQRSAVYFGPAERPLFGWLDLPDDGTASCGVVMSGPIGMEEFGAQPALDQLQEECGKHGFASLKFDYDGIGDSAGFWNDPERWDAWMASVHHAAAFMREVGVTRVVLVGVHLGALLAAKSAAPAAADGLILWEPILSGRAFLREQQLLMSTIHGGPVESDEGTVEGPLFFYDSDVVDSVRRAKLANVDLPSCCETLVISRSGGVPSVLEKVGWHADAVVAISAASQIGEYPNPHARPTEDVASIIGWIESHVSLDSVPVKELGRDSCRLVVSPDRSAIVERPVWIGDVPLFGIVAEPEQWDDQSSTVVLLTTGIWTHVGTGHMWARFAREWASRGIRTLRVDLSGIGPSGNRYGQPRQRAISPFVVDDCRQIATYFGDPSGANLVFVGTSTGGYNGLEVGLGLHPKALILANPTPGPMLDLAETDPASVVGHKAYRPFPKLLLRLATNHRRVALALWRSLSQILVNWAPESPVSGVLRRDVRVFMLLGSDDYRAVRGNVVWTLVWRRYQRSGKLEIRVVPGMDHGFYTSWQREVKYTVLTEWVTRVAGRADPVALGQGVK